MPGLMLSMGPRGRDSWNCLLVYTVVNRLYGAYNGSVNIGELGAFSRLGAALVFVSGLGSSKVNG